MQKEPLTSERDAKQRGAASEPKASESERDAKPTIERQRRTAPLATGSIAGPRRCYRVIEGSAFTRVIPDTEEVSYHQC